MSTSSERIAVDLEAAPPAAAQIARAASLVRQAWATYGDRILAIQTMRDGDDAQQLQQSIAKPLKDLQDGIKKVQDSCDSLASQCTGAVDGFTQSDDDWARAIRT